MTKQTSYLGIAVSDLEKAREFYRSVSGLESEKPILGGDGSVRVSMVPVGDVLIELLAPAGQEGIITKHLEKRGEGFHHICYEVEDIQTSVASLKGRGIEVLGTPTPGAKGLSVFLHPRGTHCVLVELVEKGKPGA